MSNNSLKQNLAQHLGFADFKPGQEEVVSLLMSGESALAVFPTGGGKSLCYQLPAVLLPGLTLVVSPLLALMKEQVDRLIAQGIAARRLDSTLTAEETATAMREARAGELRLLYIAPERFNNERFREMLTGVRVSLFAIDEAHCISEWGHNFRPDYLKLKRFASDCRAERILALTATAAPKVVHDICKELQISPEAVVRTGFYRPNLTLLTTAVTSDKRDDLLAKRLASRIASREAGATIVYVTLQKTAETVAALLGARAYHAGMKDEERVEVQNWFMNSENPIVVATIAFGMGIDKADIRYVYHYNLPKSIENYSQEIGRAGRDGLSAICEAFICPDDLTALENFIYGDTPALVGVTKLLRHLFSQGADLEISLTAMSTFADIRSLVLKTILTYLELDGYLEAGTPIYSVFKYRFLIGKAEVLNKFQGERRLFLEQVFACAKEGRIWSTLDIEHALRQVKEPRQRIIRALDYLVEKGWSEMSAEGILHRYRVLQTPSHIPSVARDIYARLIDLEARQLGRLQLVLDFAYLDGCRTMALSAHFGETLPKNCGHCSWCLGDSTKPIAGLIAGSPIAATRTAINQRAEFPSELSSQLADKLPELLAENFEYFGEARVVTRFLCGLTSPAITRSALSKHPLYGLCRDVPFAEILREVEKLFLTQSSDNLITQ